jgi:hypothetical protein
VTVLGFCFISASESALFALPPLIFLASASIQSLRGVLKADAPKMSKRLVRIAGFMLGILCPLPLSFAGALALAVCAMTQISGGSPLPRKTGLKMPSFDVINAATILHQMHYFVYCYAVLIVAYQAVGGIGSALVFFAGWATYSISPVLYKNFDYRKVFFAGHSGLILLLVGIFVTDGMLLKATLWLFTGFCGTTEYCLKEFSKSWGIFRGDSNDFAEIVGHVIGVALCLAIFMIHRDLALTPLFGASFAAMAMVLVIAAIKKYSMEGQK